MAENKTGPSEYLHAFTLYESERLKKITSEDARKAYTTALRLKGFKPYARTESGARVRLPDATMVGTFLDEDAAIAAVKDAETLAKAAHPGEFFRESAVLTPYHRLRLVGPHVASAAGKSKAAAAKAGTKGAAQPATAAKPTRADKVIANLNGTKTPKQP